MVDLFPNPGGHGVRHTVLQIGNSLLMMGDEAPGMSAKRTGTRGGPPISLCVYVPDADQAFQLAVAAGAGTVMPVAQILWGDRASTVKDPFGTPG